MAEQLNIHPDFQKITPMELPFKVNLMWRLMNAGLSFAGKMRFKKFKTVAESKQVIGLDGHRIPVWIIKPEHLTTPSPALLYFHGGGFVLRHAPQHIENAVRYAREANCCVVFVDYRLAPKYPFPAAFDDCYAALTWTLQNAEKLGVDKLRIAVGGDSAGGAIAAGVAQKAWHAEKIKLRGQLLVFPVTDSDCKSYSGKAFAEVAPFKNFSRPLMWEAYLGHPISAGLPTYASPLHGNLTGLAPAYVETGEFDPLRDESIAYAQALRENGVDVMLNETKGTVHGYDLIVPDSAISKDSVARRIDYLKKIFQPI